MNRGSVTVEFDPRQLVGLAPFIVVADERLTVTWASEAVLRRVERAVGMSVSDLLRFRGVDQERFGSSPSLTPGEPCKIDLRGEHSTTLLAGWWLPINNAFVLLATPDPGCSEDLARFGLNDFSVNDHLLDLITAREELARSLGEAVRASEVLKGQNREMRRLASIVEQAAEGIAVADLEGIIRFANLAWAAMHGYESGAELVGEHLSIFHTEEQLKTDVIPFNEEVKQRGCNFGEVGHVRKDGTTFSTMMTVTLLKDDQDRAYAIAGFARDITDRKRVADALKQMLDYQGWLNRLQQSLLGTGDLAGKLKQITDAVLEIFDADFCRVWITHPGDRCESGCVHAEITEGPHVCRHRDRCLHLMASSGRYTHIDGEAHRRVPFGCYKIGRVASQQDRKFLTNDVTHDPRVHNHEWAAELGLVSFAGYQLRPPDGETIGVLALFSKHPISADDDALLEALSITTAQVIEKCRAEERLRTAHAESTQVFAAIPSVLIAVSAQGRVTRWNEGAERTLGVPSDQAVDRLLGECPVSWPSQKIARALAKCIDSGRQLNLDDIRFTDKDGNEGVLGLTLNPFQAEAEGGAGVLLLGADITQRRIMEGQLAQSQKLEAIGQLAAGIAHEINTPMQYVGDNTRFVAESVGGLVKIVSMYEALLASPRDGDMDSQLLADARAYAERIDVAYLQEEVPEALRQSLEGIERVTKIVRAMKDFSHPNVTEKTAVDLNRAIESTATVARNEWKYVAELELDLDPELPSVECLPGEFNQVILNMITNAAHAIEKVVGDGAKEKGTITISTRWDGDWVEIRLGDTGTGIPQEIREKVFEPFFTTKEVGRGTGQGLSISRSVIVDKHGGTVGIETEMGKGTTFVIRLPIEAALAKEPAEAPGARIHGQKETNPVCR